VPVFIALTEGECLRWGGKLSGRRNVRERGNVLPCQLPPVSHAPRRNKVSAVIDGLMASHQIHTRSRARTVVVSRDAAQSDILSRAVSSASHQLCSGE